MEPVEETIKFKKPRKVKVQPEDRKQNKWSIHVKQYCIDNDMKYRDALRSDDCKSKYKKKLNFSKDIV
jgi:hypothetical protein